MMSTLSQLLTKHRNVFLLTLLVTTLLVSGYANHKQVRAASTMVSIPVTETASAPASPLEAFRQSRDQEALADIAALEKLIAQETLTESTRNDAATQLQEIISCRQAERALEGALVSSSLYPCTAVVSGGSITIVTEKATITDKDSALVLTLVAAHAGAKPENVRIITAK